MAEKKNRKKLRDINKDGKVNFGDTWLGDALGFDGKVGIQKGRPGLKESLKGARRGSASKKEDKSKNEPKRSTSRSTPSKKTVDSGVDDKAAATRRATTDRNRARGAAVPEVKTTPLGKKETPAPSKPKKKSFLDNTMSNDDYRARRQAELKRIRTAKEEASATAKDQAKVTRAYLRTREGLEALQKGITGKALDKKALEWSQSQNSGMAKGGMARFDKTGKRDYKGKGMFYDSKSPRGYK